MEAFAHHVMLYWGPLGLLLLLMFGIVGLPVPDETLMTGAGILIRAGDLNPYTTFLAVWFGSMSGTTTSYLLGVFFGTRLVQKFGPKLHLTPERFARFQRWFHRYGRWSLTFGYFVPGVRHVLAISAGTTGMKYHTFALFAYPGTLVWCTTFLVGGYFIGQAWIEGSHRVHMIMLAVGIVVALGVGGYFLVRWLRHRARREAE